MRTMYNISLKTGHLLATNTGISKFFSLPFVGVVVTIIWTILDQGKIMENIDLLRIYLFISAAFSIRMTFVLIASYKGWIYKDRKDIQSPIDAIKDALNGPAMEVAPLTFSFLASIATVIYIIVFGLAWPTSIAKRIVKLFGGK